MYILLNITLLFGLYLTSFYSYLLFHTVAELFSIIVACGIFMLAWNSKEFLKNNYLLFLGIAYLFIGSLDVVHTIAYKGMGVFYGYGANLPTQLWIISRYMESISLLLAPLFLERKVKPHLVLSFYFIITALLLGSIFYGNIFPDCFVEGTGLTPFKKISEYIICLILLTSIVLLIRKKQAFDKNVLYFLIASIIVTIGAELSFTFYISVYGFSNLVGHFLKIISFYLIYKAIIESGLKKPYDLLFRNLQQSKEKAEKYFSFAGVMLVVIDIDERVSAINKEGCEILGYKEEEVTGKNWFDHFIPERCRDEMKLVFQELVKGKTEPHELFENPVLTKSGEERIIAWNMTVLRDSSGNIMSTLSSGQDITYRKHLEEQLIKKEKLVFLGQMAGGLGHEIRNPLSAIMNAAYFLKTAVEKNDPDIKEALEIIEKEVDASEKIITNFLDFARVKPAAFAENDINILVEEALSRCSHPENIKVPTEFNKSLPRLLCDFEKIVLVFRNIIQNAVQSMPDGGHLEIKIRAKGSEQIAVSFSDTGKGIKEEDKKKLFEPLFTTKARGIGLGLSISKTYIEEHKGSIEVESEEGKGSVFTVVLPLHQKKEESA